MAAIVHGMEYIKTIMILVDKILLMNTNRAKLKRNIILFYILSASTNLFFVVSNWIYFWTKYMTYGQLGVVDALGFGLATILEIPSGAVADLLGKRKTILIGCLLGFAGLIIVSFAGNALGITLGWMITQFCLAFYSGAAEALLYDTLVDLREEKQFDQVISKSSQIESYASAMAIFVGGIMWTIDFRLPHIAWGVSYLLSAIVTYFMIEPHSDSEKFSLANYWKQIKTGVNELTQPELRKYLGFLFTLTGIYFMYSWGFIRPTMATSFGFFTKEQAIIFPCLTLFGAYIVKFLPQARKKISDIKGLVFLSGLMSAGFVLAYFPIGYFGIISLVLIAMAGKLASPWISIMINKNIQSKYRATTLSTVTLMTKIPYVVVAILAGSMVEKGLFPVFNLGISIVIIAVAIVSIFGVNKLHKI